MVILDDNCWPWLSGVIGAASNGPDFAAPYSFGHSDTASTKS